MKIFAPTFLAAMVLAALPLVAQSLSLGGSAGSGPVEVLADDGIEWNQSQRRFTASGNAVATRGDMKVRADQLIASYTEADGSTNISRLDAVGAVRLSTPTHTAIGSTGFYDLVSGRVELFGSPARLETATEVLTADRKLTYDTVRGIATAEGGAAITQGERTLRAPTLIARTAEAPGGGASGRPLSMVEAHGGVVITTPLETAYGSQGNYDANTGIATLTGSVRIVRGENVLTGSRAVVNMRTGISTLQAGQPGEGRARAVLSRENEQ